MLSITTRQDQLKRPSLLCQAVRLLLPGYFATIGSIHCCHQHQKGKKTRPFFIGFLLVSKFSPNEIQRIRFRTTWFLFKLNSQDKGNAKKSKQRAKQKNIINLLISGGFTWGAIKTETAWHVLKIKVVPS